MTTRPDFGRRSVEPELMDSGRISFDEFHHCLQTLERINTLTLAYRPTLKWMRQRQGKTRLTVLDAGSGGGDMLRRLQKSNPLLKLIGVDLNPWSKKSAELSTTEKAHIRFETADIFDFDVGSGIDIIISSLFTHHLSDDEIIRFLQWMNATARRGWFINDLHRHPLPYYFIKYAVRIFCRNRLIRHDAPVSVARAFSKADWRRFLVRAGIRQDKVRIRWCFPFRYCVSCVKP